ncbi:MAG: phosphoribosylanthranilate isomerase [Cyanobacteriota bacterium]|jgi:phosphoribosylanthranilate isomerase
MRIKLCGIRQLDQAQAIAALGFNLLGFICVPASPRYLPPEEIRAILQALPPNLDAWGVFAGADLETLTETVTIAGVSGIQLHGAEHPEFCRQVKARFPRLELIKALRLRSPEDLAQLADYAPWVDGFLLDAYHPQQLGGTGQTLPWEWLQDFSPPRPWFLAGGLTPVNIAQALARLTPDGLDLSSGIERAPGDKDLEKVTALKKALSDLRLRSEKGKKET